MKLVQDIGIGQNIRRLRKACGLTQDQVVVQLQVMGIPLSRPSYVKIEGNKHNLRISELLALQSIFQCEVSEFFREVGLPKEKP